MITFAMLRGPDAPLMVASAYFCSLFSLIAFSTIFVKRVATVDDRRIGSIPEEFRKSHGLASGKPGFALLDYSLAIPSWSLHLRADE